MTQKELIAELKAKNVAKVVVGYSGSGDSGEVDSVEFFDAAGTEIACPSQKDANGHHVPHPLTKAMDDLTCKYLEHKNIDWYNNDGGQGTLTLDVATEKIDLEHGYNEMVTNEESYSDALADVLDGEKDPPATQTAPVAIAAPVCTCKTLIHGHESGCPYAASLRR